MQVITHWRRRIGFWLFVFGLQFGLGLDCWTTGMAQESTESQAVADSTNSGSEAAEQNQIASATALEYQTDFQTDCRSDFQIRGPADWQPGQLSFSSGTTVSQQVTGHWQANWQFQFAVAPVTAEQPMEIHWIVRMDDQTPWKIVWLVDATGNGKVQCFDSRNLLLVTKFLLLSEKPVTKIAGEWQVEYSAGWVRLRHGSQVILSEFMEKFHSDVKDCQIQVKGGTLTWQRFAWKTQSRDKLSAAQAHQRQQLQAAARQLTLAMTVKAFDFPAQEQLLQQVVPVYEQVFGSDHPLTALGYNNLALAYANQKKYALAEPLYRKALAVFEQTFAPDYPLLAFVINNLALVYQNQGDSSAALPLLERSLAICDQFMDDTASIKIASLQNLALVYTDLNRYSEAEPLFQRALTASEKDLGMPQPFLVKLLSNYATCYAKQGKFSEAEQLLRRALFTSEKYLGKDHSETLTIYMAFGEWNHKQASYSSAESYLNKALSGLERTLPADDPEIASCLLLLGKTYRDQGRLNEAETLLQRSLTILEKSYGTDDFRYIETANSLALTFQELQRWQEAETLLQHCVTCSRPRSAQRINDLISSLNNLASCYLLQNKLLAAKPLYEEALTRCREAYGATHLETAINLNNLAGLHLALGQHSEAVVLLQEALPIQEQALEEHHPRLGLTYNNLATCYLYLGKIDLAEPLLCKAIANMELGRRLGNAEALFRSLNPHQFRPYINLTKLYLLSQQPGRAWQVWEQSLGRGLFDALLLRQQRAWTPAQQQHWRQQQHRQRALQRLLEQTPNHAAVPAAQRQQWQNEWQQLRSDLAQIPEISQTQQPIAGKRYSLEQIQAHLLPHQALVGWLDDSIFHYAFVVRASGPPIWVQIAGTGSSLAWTEQDQRLPSIVAEVLAKPNDVELTRQAESNLAQLRQQRFEPLRAALDATDTLPAISL